MSEILITARRWEHGWELYEGDEILTQSTSLADAPREVRDFLATDRGGEPEDYEVEVAVDMGGFEQEVNATSERIAAVQDEAARLAVRWRAIARTLRQEYGLSVRDTAAVMGVSPGRVSQLVDLSSQKGDSTVMLGLYRQIAEGSPISGVVPYFEGPVMMSGPLPEVVEDETPLWRRA